MAMFHDIEGNLPGSFRGSSGMETVSRLRAYLERLVIESSTGLVLSPERQLGWGIDNYFSGACAEGKGFIDYMNSGAIDEVRFLLTTPDFTSNFRWKSWFGGCVVSLVAMYFERGQCTAGRIAIVQKSGNLEALRDFGKTDWLQRSFPITVETLEQRFGYLVSASNAFERLLADTVPESLPSRLQICFCCGQPMAFETVRTAQKFPGYNLLLHADAWHCACGTVYLSREQLQLAELLIARAELDQGSTSRAWTRVAHGRSMSDEQLASELGMSPETFTVMRDTEATMQVARDLLRLYLERCVADAGNILEVIGVESRSVR